MIDALARTTMGFAGLTIGGIVILTVKLGPYPSYFEDYNNIRGIRALRRLEKIGYGLCAVGVLMMMSGLISAFIYGHLVNAP